MAICTNLLRRAGGKKRLVLFGVDLVLRMTAHTERIDLRPGIHNLRRSAVAARGPGFVGDVLIRFTMATCTTHIGACMSDGDILLHVVYMTDEAAAVIRSRFAPGICLRLV